MRPNVRPEETLKSDTAIPSTTGAYGRLNPLIIRGIMKIKVATRTCDRSGSTT